MKLFDRTHDKPSRTKKWAVKYRKFRNRHMWDAPGLRHSLFDAPVPRPIRMPESDEVPAELIARIIRNYQAQDTGKRDAFPQWDHLEPLKEALQTGDAASLTRQFRGLFKGMLVASMGHHDSYYFGDNNWRPKYQELKVTDLLLNVAEALGVLPVPNHAQMKTVDYVALVHTDQDNLFAAVQDAIGFSLEMPLVGGPPVFEFGGTKTSADMIRHSYLAHKLRNMPDVGDGTVLEIGAGFGSLALLAMRAGIRNYIIVDLPLVNAVQMLFLGMALGPDAVSGYGEDPARLHILPPHAFDRVADKSVALCVNVDSFPEIDRDLLKSYLVEIKRMTGRLLSVNQEAEAINPFLFTPQNIVHEVIDEVGGFRRAYRYPYWMMEGYVEELFETDARVSGGAA